MPSPTSLLPGRSRIVSDTLQRQRAEDQASIHDTIAAATAADLSDGRHHRNHGHHDYD